MSRLCNNCECININGMRCHEAGCPNQNEKIRLSDDGTLDTVFVCGHCGAEMRFTFQDHPDECDDETGNCDCYDDFVYECLHECQDEHDCDIENDEF